MFIHSISMEIIIFYFIFVLSNIFFAIFMDCYDWSYVNALEVEHPTWSGSNKQDKQMKVTFA